MREKVLGTGEYVDDMEMEGLIYGSALRGAYPRARILSIEHLGGQRLCLGSGRC